MADLEPAWEFKADDNLWAARLSHDGQLLVVGCWDSSAYALDRRGESLWEHKTSDYVKGIGISADGDLTVVGSYDRYIYAIKRSGKLAWRYKTENYVRAVGVSSDGEYVAAGSWRGTLYYLDKRGKLLWKHRIGNAILDLAVSSDGAIVVAGCEDGSIHVYDLSGNPKWTYKAGGSVTDVAVSSDGSRTLAASKDTLLVCLDPMGTLIWKFHMGGSAKGLSLIQGDELAAVFSDNNFLQYIDSTGSLLFMRRLPEEFWEGTVADDGVSVAVVTKDNRSLFFENIELATSVLEATQQTLERIITDNVDITKAQEMHRSAGELASEGSYGKAIKLALAAQILAKEMQSSQLSERARSMIDEVDGLIAQGADLDMRKAIRYVEKARRGLQEDRMERVLFYGELAKSAAQESIEKDIPKVEDELFAAGFKEPIETDESEVDRLLGMEPTGEVPSEPEPDETRSEAAELADEVAAELGEMDTEGEGIEEPEPEADAVEEEASKEEGVAAEADLSDEATVEALEDIGERPDAEDLQDLYAMPSDEEEPEEPSEEEEGEPEPEVEMGAEESEVCAKCGSEDETIDGLCVKCHSDEIMKEAVDKAKEAHKDGINISSIAPDLKAVKLAHQAHEYDEVIEISEQILDQLSELLGEDEFEGGDEEVEEGADDEGPEGKPRPRKKKRKKKRVR